MLKTCLRRFGLWPVVVGVTVISIVMSVGLAMIAHQLMGEPMLPLAWALTIGCPLIVAPVMSVSSFGLLLKLDSAHEQLRRISDTDYLTGAHNRRYFMDRLRTEAERVARGGPAFAVALIDVDNFKDVNDQYGHLAGDSVLCALAQACTAEARALDTFARFGGEEFALLMPQTGVDDALHALERLRQRIAHLRVETTDDAAEPCIAVTVSIGLACSGGTTLTPPALVDASLRRADEALYRAKREGKNRVALPLPMAA